MSKELEALEKIRNDVLDFRDVIYRTSYSTDDDYEIVKQALKELNKINELKDKVEEYLEAKLKFETNKNNNEVSADYYFEYMEIEMQLKELMSDE